MRFWYLFYRMETVNWRLICHNSKKILFFFFVICVYISRCFGIFFLLSTEAIILHLCHLTNAILTPLNCITCLYRALLYRIISRVIKINLNKKKFLPFYVHLLASASVFFLFIGKFV